MRGGTRRRERASHTDKEAVHDSQQLSEGVCLFREQFGREPGPDDPLFFDPGVAAPQFLSDESTDEIWKSLLQAAGDSGIDPAIIDRRSEMRSK